MGGQQEKQGEEAPKKRNKRLERKIKRAAYITALESNKTPDQDVTAAVVEPRAEVAEGHEVSEDVDAPAEGESKEEGSKDGKKKKEKKQQAPAPVHPEIAKLTNKEKRLLKQFQKKQQQEGVDLAAQAVPELLNPVVKKAEPKPVVETVNKKEGKKDKKDKKENKKENKEENEPSKRQQQLAKEREELLADEAPMSKADVKSAVQGKKSKKDKGKEKETTTPVAKKEDAAPATSKVAQQKQPKLTKLQEQMKKTLAGGKFRFLNEQLYTTTGEEAFGLFQSKPELFDEYHEGFRSQVELWPQNPVDIFIAQLRKMPTDTVIADLGCGDAQIAKELTKHQVLSFDLVAKNERVTACDIAHLPLEDGSVDVAIFCLSLMGTDFLKFLKEAYRVLKLNGQLKISEVISRFTDVDAFVSALKALGFELRNSDSSNKMFIMFDFVKPDPNQMGSSKKGKKGSKKQKTQEETPEVDIESLDGPSLLKPCIYKKR
ncbi:methyltransferase-domain-containing protein [Dissophora ornata]|nr:methyltransferase-domain-containing protein [Dissophora ornata]